VAGDNPASNGRSPQPAANDKSSKRDRLLAAIRGGKRASVAQNNAGKASTREAKVKSGQVSRSAVVNAIKRSQSRATLLAGRNRNQAQSEQPTRMTDGSSSSAGDQ
jgi:hypothetical protein